MISLEGLAIPNILPRLGIILVSLALFAWFTSAEVTILSVNRIRLRHLAEQGHLAAKTVQQILAQRDLFFATVVLLQNLFVILASSLAAEVGILLWGGEGVLVAAVTMTVVVVMLGELIPKSLAAASEGYAFIVARPLRLVMWLLSPLARLMALPARLISRGRGQAVGLISPFVTEDELRMLISIGAQEGTVDASQREMLHRVFQFADRRAVEVMTPRTEIVWLSAEATLADFWTTYREAPHSRFPVFEDSVDDVIGIVSIKDVLMGLAKGIVDQQSSISSFVRPAYFTPENKQISQLFAEMRDHNYHMAVVVDEFGAAVGVASLSQLTEEIVGPVGGEQGEMDKEYEIVNDNTFQIDGGMRVEEINEQMEVGLPEGDYETMAGFILHLLSRIPKQGEQLKYKNLKIVITKMQGARIMEVLVTKEVPKSDLGDKATHIG